MNAATDLPVETLIAIAPPLPLVCWLEDLFTYKRERGESVPEEYQTWLHRWEAMRTGAPVQYCMADLIIPPKLWAWLDRHFRANHGPLPRHRQQSKG
jgi:hypothetical protein